MENQVTNESRQRVMKTLGEYGCYFLSVVKVAEEITGKRIDAVEAFGRFRDKKYLDEEATMLNPDGILSELTGKKFSVHREAADYKTAKNEHETRGRSALFQLCALISQPERQNPRSRRACL